MTPCRATTTPGPRPGRRPERRPRSRASSLSCVDDPGTPAADPDGDVAGYVRGLGELYVGDPRFAANYGGQAGAEFVRDALAAYADAHL